MIREQRTYKQKYQMDADKLRWVSNGWNVALEQKQPAKIGCFDSIWMICLFPFSLLILLMLPRDWVVVYEFRGERTLAQIEQEVASLKSKK